MDFLYVRTTGHSLDEVGKRLEERIKAHHFGLLGVIDLQNKMREKGVEFDKGCRIYEVCNPQQAKQVLEKNIQIATVLPCRIVAYQQGPQTALATVLPSRLIALFGPPELVKTAQEVETDIRAMLDEAANPA